MAKTPPPSATTSPDGTVVPPASFILIVGTGNFSLDGNSDADGNQGVLFRGASDPAVVAQAVSLSWIGGVLTATQADGTELTWGGSFT